MWKKKGNSSFTLQRLLSLGAQKRYPTIQGLVGRKNEQPRVDFCPLHSSFVGYWEVWEKDVTKRRM